MHELLAVIAMISMLAMLFGIHTDFKADTLHLFPYDYLLAQSRALAMADYCEVDSRAEGIPAIRFSEKGNVSRAMTLHPEGSRKDIIIELGPGKLVFR